MHRKVQNKQDTVTNDGTASRPPIPLLQLPRRLIGDPRASPPSAQSRSSGLTCEPDRRVPMEITEAMFVRPFGARLRKLADLSHSELGAFQSHNSFHATAKPQQRRVLVFGDASCYPWHFLSQVIN